MNHSLHPVTSLLWLQLQLGASRKQTHVKEAFPSGGHFSLKDGVEPYVRV